MPEEPGTHARKVIDPSIHHQSPGRTQLPTNTVLSSTWDPFFGIEAGRTVPESTATVEGGGGTDSLNT